jgi:xanthosine utilization system XapX-like protein
MAHHGGGLAGVARKFGPSRGELLFRAGFSVAGLILLGFALWYRGLPGGPALVEVVGLAGLMFGGSLCHAVWKLVRRDHP